MLRRATAQDFAFIHEVAGNPDYARFIEDVGDDVLAAYLENPDYALVIWQPQGQPAGFALFCDVTRPARAMELRRLGLKSAGGGQGRAFVAALRDYGFAELGANCLWLDVVPDNPRALHLYKDAGFHYEGLQRARWKRPTGDVADLHLLSILRSEWDALA